MAKVTKLTHERLLEVLDYDPAIGAFCWKVRSSNRIQVGDRAGVVAPNGHRFVTIEGEKLQASRLAWFYVRGCWPRGDIKQKNGDHDDCSINNLRDVSRIDSARERGLVATNSTGAKGVSPSRFGRYQASITWNYEGIALGANFDTVAEASAVYIDAEARLKAAKSLEELAAVISALRLTRRQRAAWFNLAGQGIALGWPSFEAFAAEVVDVPERRYAIAPLDAARPVGPGNYRWSTSGEHNTGTAEGRRAYARHNRATNKDQHRDRDFRKKYGIDYAEYQRMLIAQKGVCAICEKPETKLQFGTIRMLSVDHDHDTKAVRALLCGNCNMGLGYFCDSVETLQKAIVYLRHHAGKPSNVVPLDPKRDWLLVATPGFGASDG